MVRTVDVDGSFLLARSVRRIDLQYKFHFDQSHKSPTQVRVWPNLDEYLDRKQSFPHSKRRLWFQSISWRPWFCVVSSGNLFGDDRSLAEVWRSNHHFGTAHCWRCLPVDCCWPGPRKRLPIVPSMEPMPRLPTPVKLKSNCNLQGRSGRVSKICLSHRRSFIITVSSKTGKPFWKANYRFSPSGPTNLAASGASLKHIIR